MLSEKSLERRKLTRIAFVYLIGMPFILTFVHLFGYDIEPLVVPFGTTATTMALIVMANFATKADTD